MEKIQARRPQIYASRNENLATVKHVYASNTKLKLCTFQHKEKNSDFIHLRICYFKALSSDFVEMHIPLFFVRYTLSQNEIFLVCNYIRWKLIKFRRAGIYISLIISVKFLQIIKKTFSSTFNKKPSGPFILSLNWKRTHFDPELYMIFDCIMMEDEEQETKKCMGEIIWVLFFVLNFLTIIYIFLVQTSKG